MSGEKKLADDPRIVAVRDSGLVYPGTVEDIELFEELEKNLVFTVKGAIAYFMERKRERDDDAFEADRDERAAMMRDGSVRVAGRA